MARKTYKDDQNDFILENQIPPNTLNFQIICCNLNFLFLLFTTTQSIKRMYIIYAQNYIKMGKNIVKFRFDFHALK